MTLVESWTGEAWVTIGIYTQDAAARWVEQLRARGYRIRTWPLYFTGQHQP